MSMNSSSNILNKFRQSSITNWIKSNKYPILITIGFFLAIGYAGTFHNYWGERDGIFYFFSGKQILAGEGENITLFGAGVGGPVLFAYLDSFIHNGFLTVKTIALLSGTGIVFVSYFIMRNFVNQKVALVGQLFVAFNPKLNLLSTLAINELLPIFLIFTSLYFITKKEITIQNIIITGLILGIASIFRYQSMIVLFAIIIFLLIHDKKIKKNVFFSFLVIGSFLILFSPMIVYNFNTHGNFIDSNSIIYLSDLSKFQTPEWHNKIIQWYMEGDKSITTVIMYDFELFFKNYTYNIFYHNPSMLFNFDQLNNISSIPPIPYLGIIPIIGGLVYFLRKKFTKNDFIILGIITSITTMLVILVGDLKIHFFAIIIIPVISICLLNIRKFEKNFLVLMILGVVFMISISIIPLYRSYQLFPMWILLTLLSAVFFVEVLPKIYSKILTRNKIQIINKNTKIAVIGLVFLIILINFGFSYKLFESTWYYSSYNGIVDEVYKSFQKQEPKQSRENLGDISKILAAQPDIENKYVMANDLSLAYYSNSKLLHTSFNEGPSDDTLNNFITRENWTPYEIYFSNINSYPSDRHDMNKPIPDYLVYSPIFPDSNTTWYVDKTTPKYIAELANANSSKIPDNFKLIYSSNQSNSVIYEIIHEK
jgi:hypothetical protein